MVEYNYISKLKGRHVLFTPLNWGLGHATRSIPLIREALKHASSVAVASDGLALLTLQKVLPKIQMLPLPAYDIEYRYESIFLNGLVQYPKAISTIKKEKKAVAEIVDKYWVDLVISDNRFGCYHKEIESIFLTHQLTLQHSKLWVKKIINFQNKRWLNQFDALWVPDYENSKLSGELSRNSTLKNIKFIGPQSTYKKTNMTKDIDVLIVLSGPEPQRSILEKKLLKLASKWNDRHVIFISGSTAEPSYPIPENIVYKKLTAGQEMNDLFNRSKLLISRSGYSTLMDIDKLDIPHILIPTPGQTEQEYLARYWHDTYSSELCIQKEVEAKLPAMVRSLLQ